MGSDDQRTGPLTFVDRVCDEFERLWRSGSSPRIEEFLEGVPEPDRVALTLELIAVDVYFRRAADESPSAADYVSRFPQLERQITQQFACESSASISRGATALSHEFRRDRLASTVSWTPPSAVGRYRLESFLGQGGFGEVWRGIDTELHRPVAVKLMRADRADTPQIVEAFISEGRKLAQLRHPGVVTVFDVGEAEGRCYIVSELVEGGTLAARLKGAALPGPEAALLVAKIADALHHAHLQGVIHRDIKPQNILLTEVGEPKLADFGLAANEEDQLAESPATMGTLAYMSPEAVRGASHHTDARADIYGLGIVLYQALTGRLPFVAHSPEQYREQILNREPRPPRTIDDRISPELERICLKCLRKDLADRYTTAADLARELRDAVAPPTTERTDWSTPKVALGVTAVLLLAVGIALWSKQAPTERGGAAQTDKPTDDSPANQSPPVVAVEPAPAPVPVSGKWFPLLQRPPELLIWPNDTRTSRWDHVPDEEEVWVNCARLGLLQLGEVADGDYKLQGRLFQSTWTGGLGWFFGYHPVELDGEPCHRFQSIQLHCISDRKGSKAYLQRAVCVIDGEANVKKLDTFAGAVLPQLSLHDQSLRLTIRHQKLELVEWNDVAIPELTSEATEAFTDSADHFGEFGVYVNSVSGVARHPELLLISRKP